MTGRDDDNSKEGEDEKEDGNKKGEEQG